MSRSVKSENIQDAWYGAGMKIRGNVRYIKYEKTTYLVSFPYKIDEDKPELHEKMVEIATKAGCYLFLNFANNRTWHEGTATFLLRSELLEWKRLLQSKRDGLKQSFGYLQEQDAPSAAVGYMNRALNRLESGIQDGKQKKAFIPNEQLLRLHIKEIQEMQNNPAYIYEVDLRKNRMYAVLMAV